VGLLMVERARSSIDLPREGTGLRPRAAGAGATLLGATAARCWP